MRPRTAIAVEEAATDLLVAHAAKGRPPLEKRSAYQWMTAVRHLMDIGQFDAVSHALGHLDAVHPNAARVFRQLMAAPVFGPAPLLPLPVDAAADVQVVARPGAEAAIVVFCDIERRFGLPVQFMHRWLGRQPASVVYLTDPRDVMGGGGYPSLGPDRAASVAGLRALLDRLGARRVHFAAVSGGVYPALHYGLALKADSILGFAGPTDISVALEGEPDEGRSHIERTRRAHPDYAVDLAMAYAAAGVPRVKLIYGDGNPRDRRHAERLRGLPSVELVPIPDYDGHDVIAPVVLQGVLPMLIDELLEAGAPSPPASAAGSSAP